MSHASYARIARQHAQPDPSGWTAPDLNAADWIAGVIQPLLADLLTPPSRLNPLDIRLDTRHPGNVHHDVSGFAGQPVRLVAEINLALADPEGSRYDRRHARYADWPDRLSCGLYWVGAERQIAISPGLIRDHAYLQAPRLADFAYLAGPEALRALATALLEQLRRQMFNKQKRDKVRSLQLQAITARLRQIASEEGFEFYVESTKLLIRIGIRLDESMQMLLSVPFSEFENALPELRGMVVNLRALHRRRIRFKTQQQARHAPWIKPEPPVDG